MIVIVLAMHVVFRGDKDVDIFIFLKDFIYDRMEDIFGRYRIKARIRHSGKPDILKAISDEDHATVLVKDFLPGVDVMVRFIHATVDEKKKWIVKGDNAEFLVGSIVVLEFTSFLGFHKELKTVPPARFMDVWDML